MNYRKVVRNSIMQQVLFATILMVATASVFADTFDIPQGLYGEFGFGSSPITDQSGTSSGWGANFGLGYNFNRYIGAETDMNVLGAFSGAAETATTFSIIAVGHIPVYRGLNIYLKGGESYNYVSYASTYSNSGTTLSGSGLETGAGFEFTLNDSSMRVGVDHFDLTAGGLPVSTNYLNLSFVSHID